MRRTVVALLLDATGPLPSLYTHPHRKQWAGIPFSCFRSVVDYFDVVSKSTSSDLGLARLACQSHRSKMGKGAARRAPDSRQFAVLG